MKNKETEFVCLGGPGVTIKGDVECSCDIVLRCAVQGDVKSSGTVLLEKGAVIAGSLDAVSVGIKEGEVVGPITANAIALGDKAVVHDLSARVAEVDEGAFIKGKCCIGPEFESTSD